MTRPLILLFFFFNDTATTEIYTLSLHDALPIFEASHDLGAGAAQTFLRVILPLSIPGLIAGAEMFEPPRRRRSEEHTSELQSPDHLVCRLLLEKKKRRSTMRLESEPPIDSFVAL